MKKEFMIYKEGITAEKVTICSADGIPFDRVAKIKKYLYLGFSVYNMDGSQIKEI